MLMVLFMSIVVVVGSDTEKNMDCNSPMGLSQLNWRKSSKKSCNIAIK